LYLISTTVSGTTGIHGDNHSKVLSVMLHILLAKIG